MLIEGTVVVNGSDGADQDFACFFNGMVLIVAQAVVARIGVRWWAVCAAISRASLFLSIFWRRPCVFLLAVDPACITVVGGTSGAIGRSSGASSMLCALALCCPKPLLAITSALYLFQILSLKLRFQQLLIICLEET